MQVVYLLKQGVSIMTSIMLSFTPSLPCNTADCELLTNTGQLSLGDKQLEPVCPLHGYMFESSLEDQYSSIARFVLWSYQERGSAAVIGSCSLESVPEPYNQDADRPDAQDIEALSDYERMHFDDRAWLVRYISEQGLEQVVYAVWSVDYLEFSRYAESEVES